MAEKWGKAPLAMAYVLEAVVAPEGLLRRVRLPPYSFVVPLRQGMALVPMIRELRRLLEDNLRGAPLLGFRTMPPGLAQVLAFWSASGPVAYVEADFFGGLGTQSAAVWEGGRLVLGPLMIGVGRRPPPEGSPISQALRRLGARTSPGEPDEFSAVGLARCRQTRQW